MGEAESELGHLLQLFIGRLFGRLWASRNQIEMSDFVVTLSVLLALGVVLFVVAKIWRRYLAVIASPSDTPALRKHQESPLLKTVSPLLQFASKLLRRLSVDWKILDGEVRVGSLLCVALLILAALGSWPYNFYVLTRIVIGLSFSYLALLLQRSRRFVWEAAIVFWALLFNPVAPFHFGEDVWQRFDIAALLTFVAALFVYAQTRKQLQKHSSPSLIHNALESNLGTDVHVTTKTSAYKYCGRCSVRVGRSDAFCKRCGDSLV